MRTAIFPATFEQLNLIREFVSQAARDAGMDDSEISAVELAVDEACSNIVEHAYEDTKGGEIECTCNAENNSLTIIIRDHGKPFDPSNVPTPDLDADLEDRPIGGLGIFLIKSMMDEVRFEPLGESGNVLTMVKRINRPDGKPAEQSSPWRQIVALGEELMRTEALVARRDLILETTQRLLGGRAELWLEESLFRLPGMNQPVLFSLQPPTDPILHAYKTSAPYPGEKTLLAVPLKIGGLVMGALQVERPELPFRKKEIEILDGLGGHIALALLAAHRLEVEQWRIEQLTLVRRVSAQIANVFDLDELTRRVTKLIQRTFNYYYVAIFTREPGQDLLRFRSSAGQTHARGKRLEAKLGEGLVGTVASTGEDVVTNDVHTDGRYKFINSLSETQSEAALPLKIEAEILGVLDVQSDRLGAFHPNDLLVLRALADTISIAINGARLYSEVQKRAEYLAMVAEVSDDITSTLDLDELLTKVATLIKERLGFSHVHLFTVHPNRRQIIYGAGSGARSESLKGYVLDLDSAEGVIPWVARKGLAILANDVSKEPRYVPSPFPPEDTRAEMTVPLVYDQHVVGVLDVQSDTINVFTDDDRFVFEALADNVAVAIRNADLYRTEFWRRQVADSLREVAGLISADTSLDDVLNRVLSELERNLPCDVAAIWLLDGDGLYLAQIHGADILEVNAAARRWPEAYDFLIAALNSDVPVVRKPDDPIGPTGSARGFSADYSSIAAALRAGDRPLGVLTLSHHTAGRYGHEAQAMTTTFASYAAVAIENARLFDAAQEQAYASAALLQVAETVANSNSLEETIGGIVRITPILVGVKSCAIYLWTGEQFHSTQSYGCSDEVQAVMCGKDFLPGGFPLLDSVLESGQLAVGVLTSSIPEDWLDPELARTEQEMYYAMQTGEHLLLGFPLMVKNDFYGVLLVEEVSDSRRFRQKRVEIVTSISQQIALSIQNEHLQTEMVARERFEHEVQLARQIQQTFLPEKLPEPSGWDLAATWWTAREVGGDFYDVIELPGGRLGLLIADVSDKGIPAAIFMALTRTLVRAVVFDTPSPAEVLRKVNALILPDNRQSMFVTAVYGVLSLETGDFTYANAGHNPPVWVCGKGGAMSTLRRTGAALGILDDLPMEDRTIRLEPDDFLLLYTDGLTEAFSPEEDTFGEQRLLDVLKLAQIPSAREMLDGIETSISSFMGPLPVSDDLTMLAVKRSS